MLSALATQVYLDTYAQDGVTPQLAREAFVLCSTSAFTTKLNSDALHFILAERDDRLIGFAELSTAPSAPPGYAAAGFELNRLYVQPAAQGQKIGARLLRRAESHASASRAALVWLTAWVENHRALAFYQDQGYQDVGATPFVFEGQSYGTRVFVKHVGGGAV